MFAVLVLWCFILWIYFGSHANLRVIEAELDETRKLVSEKQNSIACLEHDLAKTRTELTEKERRIKENLVVETGSITELYGDFRGGKTQLCHTLCHLSTNQESHGNWFEIVSCPHYLAEIVIYAGLLVANGGSDPTIWLLFGFVYVNGGPRYKLNESVFYFFSDRHEDEYFRVGNENSYIYEKNLHSSCRDTDGANSQKLVSTKQDTVQRQEGKGTVPVLP
ncbi:hypothetical protein IFM89_034101 [Coptis chinensis]|uniref:Rad51-like C-terminal domain-containing protein n=1 Tax=Coptis chinensis TaxID=261450 RepID=A0A835I2X5_9MAGN|nr:hypothetical protein IFM89_034101 [Coptis chinensis]